MVGGSVFYAAEARESNDKPEPEDAVEHLDKELQESEQRRLEAEKLEEQLSSLVWICTSTQKMSKVTVIDANNPADILEVFNVCESHLLCIASVPGAKESDYIQNNEDVKDANFSNKLDIDNQAEIALTDEIRTDSKVESISKSDNVSSDDKADQDPSAESNLNSTSETCNEEVDVETINLGKIRFVKNSETTDFQVSDKEDDEKDSTSPIERMSSIQPTMWLGAQNGAVFVHSAVAKWSVCLHSVKLQDAALSIV